MTKKANGEGSVRYNAERQRWEARATVGIGPNGKLVRRMVTVAGRNDSTGRRAIEAKLAELSAAADAGVDLGRNVTVARALTVWLDDILPGTVAPATEVQYRKYVRVHLIPQLGRHQLRTLAPRDVTAMLRRMEADGLAPNTRRLARSILRRALRWAETEGMVTRNVAALANAVNVPRTEGRTMTPDEARRFLDHVTGDRLEAMHVVLLGLGLRISEALGLTWDDIDLDASRLTVRRNLQRIPGHGLIIGTLKTARSRRTLHLPGAMVAVLRDHRRHQAAERLAAGPAWTPLPLGHDLVFRNQLGDPLDPRNAARQLSNATSGAGLGHWHPHELRHSAASILIAAGVPITTVAEVLGHSSTTVTSTVYVHLLDAARTEAADAIGRSLWGSA